MTFVTRPAGFGNATTAIHYSAFGASGPNVVLLHGLGLSSRFWFDVPRGLAEDPERPRRVLAIDNRGTGQSGRPRLPWTTATMADDVAAVMDDAGAAEAIVVGISMGGMIAQELALRHPRRVRGLVLLSTTPGFLLGELPRPAALLPMLALPFGGALAASQFARLLLPRSKWSRAWEIFPEWPEAMRADPMARSTFLAHLFASVTHFAGRRLAQVECPALIVSGAEDILVPKRNAEVLARILRGAELEFLRDVGHGLFAEDRDLVRRLVARLEASLSARGTSAKTESPTYLA